MSALSSNLKVQFPWTHQATQPGNRKIRTDTTRKNRQDVLDQPRDPLLQILQGVLGGDV